MSKQEEHEELGILFDPPVGILYAFFALLAFGAACWTVSACFEAKYRANREAVKAGYVQQADDNGNVLWVLPGEVD